MPELAAASTGTVRPTAQCARTVFVSFPLVPVLVRARVQLLRDLRRLLHRSLAPFVAGRRGQVSSGGARALLAARL